MDYKNNFALKYAVKKRSIEDIMELNIRGANMEKKDGNYKNLLHFACNNAPKDTEANFDLEKLLVNHGVGMNDKDILGRTPLHYCFVQMGKD